MSSNGVWCGIYAKYLAFGTYPTSAVGALSYYLSQFIVALNLIIIIIIFYSFSLLFSLKNLFFKELILKHKNYKAILGIVLASAPYRPIAF